ncbi:MAG: hypothetical protein B7Y85_09530 [Brevundimonas sp. 32-68-21]|nr:MAG: hypothetical protein B7Y85_09530 [Brevundimonas sp. 32-68-21]
MALIGRVAVCGNAGEAGRSDAVDRRQGVLIDQIDGSVAGRETGPGLGCGRRRRRQGRDADNRQCGKGQFGDSAHVFLP